MKTDYQKSPFFSSILKGIHKSTELTGIPFKFMSMNILRVRGEISWRLEGEVEVEDSDQVRSKSDIKPEWFVEW